MKDSYIIGVIGAGNMGEALIKGLLNSQLVRSYEIIASRKNQKKLIKLEKEYAIHTTKNNIEIAKSTDTIILAVKPQNIDQVSKQIAPYVNENHLIISIAAGIDIKRLKKHLGNKPKLIRVMPNLPALVDEGLSAIYCDPQIAERYKRFAHQIFQAVGSTIDINKEKMMDVVTGVSGTGPAYIFAMMEAMIRTATKLGFKLCDAKTLVLQTVLGSSILATQIGMEPKKLREKVTSKQGTTWAAMKVYEDKKFWDITDSAIKAAVKRAHELRTIKS